MGTQETLLSEEDKKILSAFTDRYRYSTLGSLVKGIIHNLNGSLQVLLLHSELLQMMLRNKGDRIDEQIHRKMEQCLAQTNKMKAIVDMLAQKAKHDEQNSMESIHVNSLLEEELSLLQHHLFFKHNVELRKEFAPHLPALKGFYIDFSQGLMNLVLNAIEAMEETDQKVLTLMTRSQDHQLDVIIRDTGCGISDEIRPFLFKPFATNKGGKHNGLGLFTSRELLTPYGASFDYASERGETTFSVHFPLTFPTHPSPFTPPKVP